MSSTTSFRSLSLLMRFLWAGPWTLVGLIIALGAKLGEGSVKTVEGTLEVEGKLARFLLTKAIPLRGGAAAMTLGHVIIARSAESLRECREHERVHVRQYERWGLLFPLAYAVASGIAWSRGQHYYRDNCFERAACAGAGAAGR